MIRRIVKCKRFLGICGTAAFFMMLSVIGSVENNNLSFFPGVLVSIALFGIMTLCVINIKKDTVP